MFTIRSVKVKRQKQQNLSKNRNLAFENLRNICVVKRSSKVKVIFAVLHCFISVCLDKENLYLFWEISTSC